jgi:glycosyltransferase involved in cell wall biosynthesis
VEKIVWLKPKKGQVSIGRELIVENFPEYNVNVFEVSLSRMLPLAFKLLLHKFDVVIGTTHLGIILGGLAKILRGKPFLVDFVDDYETLFNRFPTSLSLLAKILVQMEKIAIKLSDAVIVVPIENYIEIASSRDHVLKSNLCIDLDSFRSAKSEITEKAKKILQNAGVNFEKPIVVYVGGFSRIYNLDILVRAMLHLNEFQLILIGGGEQEGELLGLKEKLKLDNVFFLSYLPNEMVAGILKLCDVGVTLCEIPRQLKIYEYLASGLKVVTPSSILRSKDFEFGEYCFATRLNEKDVAKSIERAIIAAPKEVKKLGRLLEKYDCRRLARTYISTIESLMVKK